MLCFAIFYRRFLLSNVLLNPYLFELLLLLLLLLLLFTKSMYCFQDKAQALQNSCRSLSTENRAISPRAQSFDPPTPPSSTKKPVASSVMVID